MIKIEIEKQTRQVTLPNNLNPLGYDGENLQDTLEFSFTDTFVNGQARLELQYENKEKTFITLEKVEETYTIPITKIMTVEGQVYAQLVITEGTNITQPPIFKSKMFYYFVGQSINAETGAPEPYIEWIDRANAKLNQVDEALETINGKIDEIDTAIEETSNLNIDANKVDKTTTVEITKKDNTKKVVQILDGVSLQFMWQGTSLGIKTDNMQDYVFVDLQGVEGKVGPQGEPFRIKKTYSSVAEMNADFNNMEYGDYVMIASSVEVEDNAKLYTRGESTWIYITDFSGATGIRGATGLTPSIRIGTVTSGDTPSVTRTGTDEEPILNFVLQKGDKGDKPIKGVDYFTQSDIDSMVAQVTEDATSEFNQNVTAKTNEFNTNATNKTTDFNTNATAKTTAFNDNATQKTNEFNTNAQNKTDEFNDNVEDLELRLERSEMVYNALPKVTGEGTSVTLDNTANAPMKMIPMASELEQASTTGKQLIGYNNSLPDTRLGVTFSRDGEVYKLTGTSINYYYKTFYTIPAGTLNGQYKFKKIKLSGTSNVALRLVDRTVTPASVLFETSTEKIFDITNSHNDLSVEVTTGNSATYDETFEVLLQLASITDDTYEPYTGGNPAPNPDYPQEIHTISGDNEIIVGNKNLAEIRNDINTYGGTASTTYIYYTSTITKATLIKIEPNTAYTFYREKTNSNSNSRYFFYDTKPIISSSQSTQGTLSIDGGYFPEGANVIVRTTSPATAKWLLVRWTDNASNLDGKLAIYKGSYTSETLPTYVEHQEQTLPLNLGDLEVCKIGDYEDEFVKLSGKNLFDKNNANVIEGYLNASGVVALSSADRLIYIACEPNTTYSLQKMLQETTSKNRFRVGTTSLVPQSGTTVEQFYKMTDGDTKTTYTITTNSTANYLVFYCYASDTLTLFDTMKNSIQIEKNDHSTSYEPYVASAGWYLKKNIGKVVLDGSENEGWVLNSTSQTGVNRFRSSIIADYVYRVANADTMPQLKCNYFAPATTNQTYLAQNGLATSTQGTIFVYHDLLNSLDVSGFKTWLSTHNTIVYYQLATPTYTLLSDTLQTQLNNIRDKVLAYQEQTNINQTNNDLPFNLSASAIRDLSNIFELIGE